MKRHVYQPPKARLTDLLAALGGLLAAVAVFVVVPLTQKMSAIFGESFTPPPEMTIEPPEDQSFEMEEPPEEPEDEPEPEEMPEDAPELDFAIDVDLTAGAGGSFVMDVPNFGLKGGEDPFGEGMDSPPTPVNRMPPQYPSALLKRGIGGKVVITCVIDAKGGMVSSKIKQSSGQSDLDKAALQAVGRWKFKPARRAGKPIQATCNIPFTFEVKKN